MGPPQAEGRGDLTSKGNMSQKNRSKSREKPNSRHHLCSDVTKSRMFRELKLGRAIQIRFQYQEKNCTHLTLTVRLGSAYTGSAFLLSPQLPSVPPGPGCHLEKQLPVGEDLSPGTQHTPPLPHPTFPVPAYSDGLHPLLGFQMRKILF